MIQPKVANATKQVYQYFYRATGCKAKNGLTDPSCICWHDEGTGPFADWTHDSDKPIVGNVRLHWRTVNK